MGGGSRREGGEGVEGGRGGVSLRDTCVTLTRVCGGVCVCVCVGVCVGV